MTTTQTPNAESRFKTIIREMIAEGIYPSPNAINERRAKVLAKMGSLSGRECTWREEVFGEYAENADVNIQWRANWKKRGY